MSSRRWILACLVVAVCSGGPAVAVDPGAKGRIAGDGPDAKYYLAKDVEAGILMNQLHTLEFLKSQGEPDLSAGFDLADIEAMLKRTREGHEVLHRKGRIVEVKYNLLVTTVEKEQTVHYPVFPNTDVEWGKDYTATLTRVRVDDGPLKGREFYARRLVDRDVAVATDRAWLRVPGMKAIPLSDNRDAVERFWKGTARRDSVASAQAYIDGSFVQVPPETQCTVLRLTDDHLFAQISVKRNGETHEYWVLATVPSPEAPKK